MRLRFVWMVLYAVSLLHSAALSRSQSPPVLSIPAQSGAAAQPSSMAVIHRSGQSFIRWRERTEISGERYRIYRHAQPITAASLPQATLLYEVAEGSSNFYANRYYLYKDDGSDPWQARYVDRMVIVDRGDPVPQDNGLLVWTLSAQDIAAGANGYYAVTTVDAAGAENRADFAPGNSVGPVSEAVADPSPVELAVDAGARGHIFAQYMDLRRWNPTFHAPHAANEYYGLNPDTPGIAKALAYAYDYAVYEPDPDSCGGSVPARVPVILILHGWDSNSYGPATYDPDVWCAYKIYPVDQSETWYFGFARGHDFRQNSIVPAGDVIVNYTEQRLLRMIYDLGRHSQFGSRVDANRVYVYGQSMGGGGALALAMRFPNVFAAAYASQPTTNFRTRGDSAGISWVDDPARKWGSPALNLPVQIGAPGGWATHLQAYNTTGVWDWQNHQGNFQDRLAEEMTPLGIGHGRNDTLLEWSTQGQPVYGAIDGSRRAWGGAITDQEHTWMEFVGLPPTLGLNDALVPFAGLRVVRQESVPGLSNASANAPLPPDAPGGYNQTLDWSASWNPWDGAPVDTTGQWRISLRTTNGSAQTVNVTPRRLQSFQISRGRTYGWENRRVSDNALIASGSVVAEQDGLVTVPGFAVSAAGNRLVLRAVSQPTPTATRTPGPTPTGRPANTPTATVVGNGQRWHNFMPLVRQQ